MTDNYFDVMKIYELINSERNTIREEEILKAHYYTRSKYEVELNKLVYEGEQTVEIDYSNYLGGGGLGEVYTCDIKKERNLKCKYAIKLIDVSQPTIANLSLIDQIIPLCKINHENVINVHSLKVIKKDNRYFYGIVFQYIENIITLDSFVKNHSSTLLTKEETYKILDGLIAGIEALHKKNFLHGDINTENILITPDKSIVYIDPDVTKLYWKNQLDNSLSIIPTMINEEDLYVVNNFNTTVTNMILSKDISIINKVIKEEVLKISKLDSSKFSTNISTISQLKQQLKKLF